MIDAEIEKWAHVARAIETNDTTPLNQALSMTPAADLEWFYHKTCSDSIRGDSIATLQFLIDHGMSVKHLTPNSVACHPPPSKETLEFLLAQGWDINWRGPDPPFMWYMASYTDMITWCLEHGASVLPSDRPWERHGVTIDARHCDPILYRVANSGNLAAFKLLRSKGAPLGQRLLHRAVEAAAAFSPESPANPEKDTEQKREYGERYTGCIELVHYLLEVVRLDVNAPDQAPGCTKGMSSAWGTPLCYVPGAGMPQNDSRELTWLLLDRGADPAPALEVGKDMDNWPFVENVKLWMKQNPGVPARTEGQGRRCCMQ